MHKNRYSGEVYLELSFYSNVRAYMILSNNIGLIVDFRQNRQRKNCTKLLRSNTTVVLDHSRHPTRIHLPSNRVA